MESITREEAKESLFYGTNNKRHICETLRFVYDEVYNLPESPTKTEMTERLIDAMQMAKKMQNRLAYYQKTYKDNTGNKAVGLVGLTGVRARSRMRKARRNETV